MIHLISCISSNAAIGSGDALLFKIKEDMKRFREMTEGNIVLMGRKTFESIIKMNGKPLPKRINVVLTRDKNYVPQMGETAFHSVEHIIRQHETFTEGDKHVYVCGGSEIYEAFLPYVDEVHLTIVNKHVPEADVFYPMQLQDDLGFEPVHVEEHYSDEYDCFYKFVTYKRQERPVLKETE